MAELRVDQDARTLTTREARRVSGGFWPTPRARDSTYQDFSDGVHGLRPRRLS